MMMMMMMPNTSTVEQHWTGTGSKSNNHANALRPKKLVAPV
jgi:hypothetical protein